MTGPMAAATITDVKNASTPERIQNLQKNNEISD
jgi:hypothetical protein